LFTGPPPTSLSTLSLHDALPISRGPLPGALAVQTHANPDVRLDPHLFGDPQRLLQFLEFLDHDNDRFAEPATEHGSANKSAILRSEEHTSELQSLAYLVCRLLLE